MKQLSAADKDEAKIPTATKIAQRLIDERKL